MGVLNSYDIFKNASTIREYFEGNVMNCVIGIDIAHEYGICKGDYISIQSREYCVNGIIDIPYYNKGIYIQVNSINKITYEDGEIYLFMKEDNNVDLVQVEETMKNLYGPCTVTLGKDIIKEKHDLIFNMRAWLPSIIIAVIALVYGVINIVNIENFYFRSTKAIYGIMQAYGASKMNIFCKIYGMYGLVFLLATIGDFGIGKLMEQTYMGKYLAIRIDSRVCLLYIILGQILALIFSKIRANELVKNEIASIIKTRN